MASSRFPKMCFHDVDWSAWAGPKPASSRCRSLALRHPLSPLPVAGLDLRVLRSGPVGFSLNHRPPAMTFVSSSKRYHRVGHQNGAASLEVSCICPSFVTLLCVHSRHAREAVVSALGCQSKRHVSPLRFPTASTTCSTQEP
jgi:hypothetical protein